MLVIDEFPPIARAREWVTHRFGEDSSIAYLAACPWCSSAYVGAAVATTAVLWGHTTWWQIGALASCGSAVAGLVSAWEPE